MTRRFLFAFSVSIAGLTPAAADLITMSMVGGDGRPARQVTPTEYGNPIGGQAPVAGDVYQFVVTTDADIISVNQVRITTSDGITPVLGLYNNTLGDPANAEPFNHLLLDFAPAGGVDSWFTTPGVTSRLGPDLPGDGTTTFGDLTNNGPQTNFIVAQLTFPAGTLFRFTGRISIASTQNPGESYVVPFRFFPHLGPDPDPDPDVPEPNALVLAGLAIASFATACHRL